MSPRTATDRAALAAMFAAVAMIAQQVGGKATRDALFLSSFDIEYLPNMMIGAAVFSLALVAPISRAMTAFGPGRFVPAAFAASAVLLVAEWGLSISAPAAVSIVLYLHIAAFGPVLASGFWSLVNERFDPRTAKRRIGRIAGGATLGGLLGGILAERVGTTAGITVTLPFLAVLHLFCAWRIRALIPNPSTSRGSTRTRTDSSGADKAGSKTGIRLVLAEPYLRNLALLTLLGTVAAGLIDYVFKTHAAHMYQGPDRGEALIRFFAVFYTSVGLLTFVVQTMAARRLLERVGIARTVSVLPAAVAAGSLVAMALPGLVAAAGVRGAESVFRSSVFRSGYELFYTPLSKREKRSSKTIVDVGADRLGDAIGGGLIKALLYLPTTAVLTVLLAIACALGLTTLWIAKRLGQGYRRVLEKSLLSQAVRLEIGEVQDSTTRTIMLQTIGAMDRTELLRKLDANDSTFSPTWSTDTDASASTDTETKTVDSANSQIDSGPRARGGSITTPSGSRDPAPPANTAPPSDSARLPRDPLLDIIAALRSGDPRRVRGGLAERSGLEPSLVPHVLPLLAWDSVSGAAVRALRANAHRHTGQILDALLDPEEEFAVRRRIPRIFAASPTQRAVNGLLLGLKDKRFEVRYQCGRTLAVIHRRHEELGIPSDRVYSAVLRELEVDPKIWEGRRLLDQPGSTEAEPSPLADEVLRRTNRSLEHLFNLLSLALNSKPLRVAYQGLQTNDDQLRGTALEYLESVLPSAIREQLWPFLEIPRGRKTSVKDKELALRELMRSHPSISLNIRSLNESFDARDEETKDGPDEKKSR